LISSRNIIQIPQEIKVPACFLNIGRFVGAIGDYSVKEGGKLGFYFKLLNFGEGATSNAAVHRELFSSTALNVELR